MQLAQHLNVSDHGFFPICRKIMRVVIASYRFDMTTKMIDHHCNAGRSNERLNTGVTSWNDVL